MKLTTCPEKLKNKMMQNNPKILIFVGGPVAKLEPFKEVAGELNVDLTVASFSDISYKSGEDNYTLSVGEQDIADFDVIYFRMVGRRLEDATLVANYAKKHGIKVFDRLYQDSLLVPSSISKALETAKMIEAGVPMPKTIFGSLKYLRHKAPELFGFPFVLKSTTGKKAREVWAPSSEEELSELLVKLREMEKSGVRFFAQAFTQASQRYRVFVLGGQVVAALTQPTKWRKRFSDKLEGEKGVVEADSQMTELALAAANAVDLDISGVDILKIDNSGELVVIEANAAPSWNLVKKYTDINVEREILLWLAKQI